MQISWTFRQYVRIGAIALLLVGTVALGHDPARAQFGVNVLRQGLDEVKGRGRNPIDRLNDERPSERARDAVNGRLKKDKSGRDRGARENFQDRSPQDRFRQDRLTKDRLTKDRLTKDRREVQDRFSKDRFSKDRFSKDGLKDRLPKDASKDRLSKDRLSKDTLPKDRFSKDAVGKDKGIRDRLTKDKGVAKDKGIAQDKGLAKDKGFGKDRTALDKAGADRLKSARSQTVPERRAMQRIVQAKTPLERGRIRVDHRRSMLAARLRLPPRPFPGAPGFTGVPPAGETRFSSTEMVFHTGPNVSRASVEAAAQRHGIAIVAAQPSAITGGTVYIGRMPGGVQVASAVRAMEAERLGVASPNYVYRIVQDTAAETSSSAGSPEQYVVDKLKLAQVHKSVTGKGVLVAVIDSKVDANHPDLAHAITEQHDGVGRPEQPHTHGTGMAGAIVSHRKLLGIAPDAKVLAVHAFATSTRQTPEATTRQIIVGMQWAIDRGARVINMSFAGPYDPMLQLAMRNAHEKGVILIAASGNQGAKSPPLYPAADPHVIAVTATDHRDELFAQAVRGPHVDIAAPGVDVIVPAPADTYQLTTGTSVAAAHVSGVAALLLERHPDIDTKTLVEVLTATARNLNPRGRDDLFGWGLIDPAAALQELDSRVADGKAIAVSRANQPKPGSTKAASEKAFLPKTAAPKSTAPRPAAATSSPAP